MATNKIGAWIKDQSDEALMRVIRADPEDQGAKEAVAELFGRYQARVYQWCFRYAKDHDRALDLSQEVFLGAYQSMNQFGGRASFSSWLFAVTRNRCVSAMRKRSPLESGVDDPELVADVRSGPDSEIEDKQETEALLELMRTTLEPNEQEAMCLQIFERMPVDSITEVLGISGSTGARGVLQNARRKLRAALAKRFELRGDANNV